MLKEKLSDTKTYYEVIERISKYLVMLPQSRFRIINPLNHVFTDRQAIELRFRHFQKRPTGGHSTYAARPYLPKWLLDEEPTVPEDGPSVLPDRNRVVVAPSAVNAINRICKLMRKGEYDFSRLRAVAILKNPRDRYDGVPRKSKLQLNAYRALATVERDEYRLMMKPCFPDSLVLGALGAVIMELFPADYFLPECCGYLPGRGSREAVRQAMARLSEGYTKVLRLDVRSFNETVPRERLMGLIRRRAQEVGWNRSDVDLLEELTHKFFFKVDEVLGNPGVGIGMGTSLTPLFTNIYLDQLDRYLKRREMLFSRFGDDVALFFADWPSVWQSQTDIMRFVPEVLGQEIREAKMTVAELRPAGRDTDHACPRTFDFCAYRFEMNVDGRPVLRIKDDTIAKIRRRIKLVTRVPKERIRISETDHAVGRGGGADAYAKRIVMELNSLLGFFPIPSKKNGRTQMFFSVTGWPASFLNDASSEEMKEQFRQLDGYILYRLKRLVNACEREAEETGKFRERMRNAGLRTFVDAWNRHARPYRY